MKNATTENRASVIDILSQAFDANQSVNYIIRQDSRRASRIRALIAYSYDICSMFGEVILSEDQNACALIFYPDKKRTTLRSTLLDLKLIITSIGIRNVYRTLRREALLKRVRPDESMCYLWFIGVKPVFQHRGMGSRLLKSIIENSAQEKRPVYLETSTRENLPWYEKLGFETYHEQKMGYYLQFLRRPADKRLCI